MKKIVIVGAGGFGREVKMLIEQINKHQAQYEFLGFYDDSLEVNTEINSSNVLGSVSELLLVDYDLNVVISIAEPKVKKRIFDDISKNENLKFPSLIHPNVLIGNDSVSIGQGCIICASNIITVNIKIGSFVILNLACTTGHDTTIGDYSSFMPSVNISGEVEIDKGVYCGTGAKIINRLSIGEGTVIGAGAVVSKSLPANCTAVGIPAKPIKFHNE